MVVIVEPSFFPYEIFLLATVIAVFVLIFSYLIRSLDSKKEVQLNDIERKLDEKINESQRILNELKSSRELYLSDPNRKLVTDRHNDLIEKYLEGMKKLDHIRLNKPKIPLRELQEINKNIFSLEYFYNKRIEGSQ